MHGLSHWLGRMSMTLAFMVRIARAFWNLAGTDRRARSVYRAGCRCARTVRGIGIRIEDDIVITETGNETSPPAW